MEKKNVRPFNIQVKGRKLILNVFTSGKAEQDKIIANIEDMIINVNGIDSKVETYAQGRILKITLNRCPDYIKDKLKEYFKT